jgi:hypothetical protein
MSSGARFIQNRRWLVGALAFSLFEVVASWRGMGQPAPATHDWVLVFGLAWTTVICTVVAAKTTFIGDRVVIGPMAAAAFLSLVLRLSLPDQQTVHIMRAIISSMWLASLVGGIFILVLKPRMV